MCQAKNSKQELVVFLHHATDLLINKKDWHVFFVLGTLVPVSVALFVSGILRIIRRFVST